MKPLQFLLHLLLSAFLANAQNFKVIQETDDYILKEIDSAFYYSHGNKPHDDFIIDSSKIYITHNGFKLPLDNGKFVEFKGEYINEYYTDPNYHYYGENKQIGYYKVSSCKGLTIKFYLVNKKNGEIDTINFEPPVFSPTNKYYLYFYPWRLQTTKAMVIFKNIYTKNQNYLFFDKDMPSFYNDLKWINDNSFVFYTDTINKERTNTGILKYCLLEIKENMNKLHDSLPPVKLPINPNEAEYDLSTETDEFILKEVDSAYYYSHGTIPKQDNLLDTKMIPKIESVIRLPLDNGSFKEFRDIQGWYDKFLKHYINSPQIYDYLGYFPSINLYIIKHNHDCSPYYLINKTDGTSYHQSCKIPKLSPGNIFYGHCYNCCESLDGNIFIVNPLTNKEISIELNGVNQESFKWIDDYSFVVYTKLCIDYPKDMRTKKKYYLVQIKH